MTASPRPRRRHRLQSGLWYRQATACGVSTGAPASIDMASRMNWACVQASGVAEKVGSPGPERR